MSKNRPLIGVTPWYDYDQELTYIKPGYLEGINKSGGLGILLPMTIDENIIENIMDRCEGFLISGGPDVDPKYYNEVNLPFNSSISPLRDKLELFIIKKAIKMNKPILGICRGIQIMNVAIGGTLYQDIESQITDRVVIKHSQEAPKWHPTHKINIQEGSIIHDIFKSLSIDVNSFHHQAIKDIAPGFRVSSTSDDGIIESIEYNDHKFAVGIQCHPELMWEKNPLFLNLFYRFVNSCL